MYRTQMDYLIELMEVSFLLVETALYLDKNPIDEKALKIHNNAFKRYSELETMYQEKYGPLKDTGMNRYSWGYSDGPWPWQMNFVSY